MVFLCGRVGKSTRLFRGPSFPLHPTPEVYPDLHISFPPTNHQPSLVPSHKTHTTSCGSVYHHRIARTGSRRGDFGHPHSAHNNFSSSSSTNIPLISDRPLPVFAIIHSLPRFDLDQLLCFHPKHNTFFFCSPSERAFTLGIFGNTKKFGICFFIVGGIFTQSFTVTVHDIISALHHHHRHLASLGVFFLLP